MNLLACVRIDQTIESEPGRGGWWNEKETLEARMGIKPTYKGFADSLNFIILWARLAFTDVFVAGFDRFSRLVVPTSAI
jgi:hypothetical protein